MAFPTETVYGLGCHALDKEAINKVFIAKERPLTDPLIIHVLNEQQAQELWTAENDSQQARVLSLLTSKFWPGPLTLVARAASHVPPIVMANTGFVACRCPSHALARKLLEEAQVPIAAPSANKFGHVSPTRAQHVWNDLCMEDVWILEENDNNDDSVCCDVGVESTVAKFEGNTITVLRQGAISASDLRECLQEEGLHNDFVILSSTKKLQEENVAAVSPGQCFRHYSPDISSYMLSSRWNSSPFTASDITTTVVIDYHQTLVELKSDALAYRDLSSSGDSSEAAQAVFETLRWAEQVEGATRIVFPELNGSKEDALLLAVKDRLTRAASGIVIDSLVL